MNRGRVPSPVPAADSRVFAVAGGNHVTLMLRGEESAGVLDVIEVLAQPGGGPPPHRHAFAEWFYVREGELTIAQARDDIVGFSRVLRTGESVWMAPWTVHGTLNLSDAPARFLVVGQPAAMTGYFTEAGVPVTDEDTPPTRKPPGPRELASIASRWGIEFWTGPVDMTPV